jgi:hypothetical protein
MSKEAFTPIIPPTSDDSRRTVRRTWRTVCTQALMTKEGAEAIAPFKLNGGVHGHKVLDDGFAVLKLIEATPEPLKALLTTDRLNLLEKSQQLNHVLRGTFEMDQRGKLTGLYSKRYLTHQAK